MTIGASSHPQEFLDHIDPPIEALALQRRNSNEDGRTRPAALTTFTYLILENSSSCRRRSMLFRARRARLSEASRPVLDMSGDHHMEPQWRKAYSHNHFPHGFRSLQWSTMESEGCREKRITAVTPSLLCCNDCPLRTLRVDTPKWICQAVLMGKPTGAGMRYCLGALGFYMPFYSDSRKPP